MDPERYPIKLKRDLRVSSPQPLFRALADLLEEHGFQVRPKQSPELEAGALPGTATFTGRLLGLRDSTTKPGMRWQGAAAAVVGVAGMGVMAVLLATVESVDILFPILGLVVGAVLTATGLGKLLGTPQRLRRLVDVRMEGESYQAGATRATSGNLEPAGSRSLRPWP